MTKSPCIAARSLSAYIYGGLSYSKRSQILDHTATCDKCWRDLRVEGEFMLAMEMMIFVGKRKFMCPKIRREEDFRSTSIPTLVASRLRISKHAANCKLCQGLKKAFLAKDKREITV